MITMVSSQKGSLPYLCNKVLSLEMKHRLEPIRKFTKGKTSGGRRTATPASKKKE